MDIHLAGALGAALVLAVALWINERRDRRYWQREADRMQGQRDRLITHLQRALDNGT